LRRRQIEAGNVWGFQPSRNSRVEGDRREGGLKGGVLGHALLKEPRIVKERGGRLPGLPIPGPWKKKKLNRQKEKRRGAPKKRVEMKKKTQESCMNVRSNQENESSEKPPGKKELLLEKGNRNTSFGKGRKLRRRNEEKVFEKKIPRRRDALTKGSGRGSLSAVRNSYLGELLFPIGPNKERKLKPASWKNTFRRRSLSRGAKVGFRRL